MKLNQILTTLAVVLASSVLISCSSKKIDYMDPAPFGADTDYAKIADLMALGEWWDSSKKIKSTEKKLSNRKKRRKALQKMAHELFISVPREEAIAFALYTQDHGVLKLTAQCFPLHPNEPKQADLEIKKEGVWKKISSAQVMYPGWDLQFRVENWDGTKDVPYRVKLGDLSTFEGLVRKDPIDKESIVVASMSCNSPKDGQKYTRTEYIEQLTEKDPDLLFFAGDQNYTHEEATYGWIQFGLQFKDIIRNRPTVCIPDDHDIGHGNLWGEGGIKSDGKDGDTQGGYKFPPNFVKMVERQQTWNLPDAFDPTPIKQGINVYYTDLNIGGVSFAILEDRKFKTGPKGRIPKMGPRYDHVNDPSYDPKSIDLPGLKLLGERQLKFLDHWARDWTGASMKAALSQTAFAGAVHLHRVVENRLLADLDSNGWPQSARNEAVKALRRARASHLCGDQHLAVVVKHGIDEFRDGPYAFTSPALVNKIAGRWWWPEDGKTGGGEKIDSSLPWVGDYSDGFGNKITMHAYANSSTNYPTTSVSGMGKLERRDGYGLVHFNKRTGDITMECWPRFLEITDGKPFEGWPITFNVSANDGRKPIAYLDEVKLPVENAVVELTDDESGELIYCYRTKGNQFKAPVFRKGTYTLKAGKDKGEKVLLAKVSIQ